MGGGEVWWRGRAWRPLEFLSRHGYTLVADAGSHLVLARVGGPGSGWIAAAPLDWPGGYTYTVRGRVYATLDPAVGPLGGLVVVREARTLEPVALAEAAPGRGRVELRVLEGSPPRWGILDPYTAMGLEPPSAAAVRAALDLEPRLVILARASLTPGSSQGLQALPPGPVVAVAPCRPGGEWPGLSGGLAALRGAVRACVRVGGPGGVPGVEPGYRGVLEPRPPPEPPA